MQVAFIRANVFMTAMDGIVRSQFWHVACRCLWQCAQSALYPVKAGTVYALCSVYDSCVLCLFSLHYNCFLPCEDKWPSPVYSSIQFSGRSLMPMYTSLAVKLLVSHNPAVVMTCATIP